MPTNVRAITWLVVLPVLALAPAFAGSRTRDAAPATPTPPSMVSAAASNPLPPIHFAAGATRIRPSDTKILDAHAVWLRHDRKRVLLIEGHTDGPGDSPFNQAVGEQRAQSARKYLLSKGALADRVVISFHGGERPACKEKTAPCRAINRRVTFSEGVPR